MKKTLLVIIDGGADIGRSAFAASNKPYMDMLASNSHCGIWSGPRAPGFNKRSMSSVATLQILGYSYKDEPGRGYLEALGAGLKPPPNSVCIRGNFATVRGTKIIDRRAGRDAKGLDTLVAHVNKKIPSIDGVKIKVYRTLGHRIVIVMSGKDLSRHVSDNDLGPRLEIIKPLDLGAEKTAVILNEFLEKAGSLLSRHSINKTRKTPANYLLVRSAGSHQTVEPFVKKYKFHACVISGTNVIRGIAKYIGMDIMDTPLAETETDLIERTEMAARALGKYDLVVFHINGTNTCSHDKNFHEKVRYIEKIDREVFSRLSRLRHVNIVVICDHITSSRTGEHEFGPVPFMIYESDYEDDVLKGSFDEKNCSRGFFTDRPMEKILSVV